MEGQKKQEFNFDERFNSKCDSLKKRYPKAIFLNISSWLTPKYEDDMIDYHSISKKLRKSIKQTIYNNIDNNYFDPNKTIVDLNLKESGIKYNKKSYVECEITLITNNNPQYTFDELNDEVNRMNRMVISDSFLSNSYFQYSRKK